MDWGDSQYYGTLENQTTVLKSTRSGRRLRCRTTTEELWQEGSSETVLVQVE